MGQCHKSSFSFSRIICRHSRIFSIQILNTHKMQKQLLRSLAGSGRKALLEVLYNGTKMKRSVSISSVFFQGHSEGQQQLTRAYSLAVAAQNTVISEASKYIFHIF